MVPLVWFFTITPLIALFIFNIAITKTINMSVDNFLKTTVISSYSAINEVIRNPEFQTDKIQLEEKRDEIRRVLYNSRRNSNVEIYLFDSSGEFVVATGYTVTKDESELVEKIENNLDKLNLQNVLGIRTASGNYAVMGYMVSGLYFAEKPYVVFVSSYNILDFIVAMINMSLFAMIAVGIIIASVITDSVAKKIEKSLISLNKSTEKISEKQDFIPDETIDITEIHNLSVGIGEMAGKIKEYDMSQKAFLQNISHEIKNPLMAIQGYAEGLEKEVLDDPKEAGEIISKETKRLNNLLTELLTLTKIENRQYTEESQVIDINELITDYSKTLNGMAIKESKEIKIMYSPVPLFVKLNEELFHQCVINIGGNAIRFAKKRIDVSVEKENDLAVIKIKDDGPGFSSGEMQLIFNKFYKGEKGVFGLGLAIAKEAITQLGGVIKVENTGGGALFVIKLPLY